MALISIAVIDAQCFGTRAHGPELCVQLTSDQCERVVSMLVSSVNVGLVT